AAARASLLRGRVASASGRHDLALKDVSSGLEALARLPEESLDAVDVANVDASLLLLRGEVRSRTIAKGAGEEDHRRALARIEPFDTDNALRTRALVLERLGKSAQARGDLDGAAEFFQRHLEIVEG